MGLHKNIGFARSFFAMAAAPALARSSTASLDAAAGLDV